MAASPADNEMQFCEKCHKTMLGKMFYTYKDGRKTELCKQCLTMFVNVRDPSTYLWIFEKMDVPYIEEEFNALLEKAYARNPHNLKPVVGKYLSKMKLKQWKDYGYADSERLQAERNGEAYEEKEASAVEEKIENIKEQYENGLISKAQYDTQVNNFSQDNSKFVLPPEDKITGKGGNPYLESNFVSEDSIDLGADLTEEDKTQLLMKWGRLYKPSEWISLEENYNQMMESFDIQDADTINTLKLLCKTNLKMNQAIDCGD